MISTGAKFNQRQGAEVDLWAAGCLEVHLVLGGQSQVVVTSSLDAQYSTCGTWVPFGQGTWFL